MRLRSHRRELFVDPMLCQLKVSHDPSETSSHEQTVTTYDNFHIVTEHRDSARFESGLSNAIGCHYRRFPHHLEFSLSTEC